MFKKGSSIRNALGVVSLLWFGSLAGAGFAFFTQVVLARELTPEGYGVFSAALATVTLVAPLAGFGVHGVWLKVFGAEGWHAIRWLPASFHFVMFSAVTTMLLFSAWAVWGPHDGSTTRLLFLLFPLSLGYLFMELVSSKLLLEERFSSLALWQLLPHFARLLLVLLVVFAGLSSSDVSAVAIVYALVAVIVIVIGSTHLKMMLGGRITLKGHVSLEEQESSSLSNAAPISLFNVAQQAWPFGLAAIFHLIYFQSDIILLKYIIGDEAAGLYNVAFTVMAAVYLLPSVIYQKFLLPKIHRWANHDRERFYKVYRQGNIAMLLLGTIAMLALWMTAFWWIPLLFGDQYVKTVVLLNVLAVCAPILFVASSVGATLMTREHMSRKVIFMGGVAALNIVLNFLLIPRYGAIGAAVSTVLSNLVLLVIYYIAAQSFVFATDLKSTIKTGNGLER